MLRTAWISFLSRSTLTSSAARRLFMAVLGLFWISMFVGTHLPKPPDLLEDYSDKTLHFLAFAGLGFLLALSTAAFRKLRPAVYVALWGVAVLYAAADELLQIPVGRHCSLDDWLADAAGAASGLVLLAGLRQLRYRLNVDPLIEQAE